jgi:hypothetical protein|tara:strand:- start:714 stop:959 length:246 start_codon:yes stop_codon:yes gene_type:complete
MKRIPETTKEQDVAMNVLLTALNLDYSMLEPETIANLYSAIDRDSKVKNSVLLYLSSTSDRARLMRNRLKEDVLALYERGY